MTDGEPNFKLEPIEDLNELIKNSNKGIENKPVVAEWGTLEGDEIKSGLPPAKAESIGLTEEQQEGGIRIIKNMAEMVYEGWDRLHRGAGNYFGSTYDGQTQRSEGSTESYLDAALNGTDIDNPPEDYKAMVELAAELKHSVQPQLEEIKRIAETRMVGGPAENFYDEVKYKYDQMAASTDPEEVRRLSGEISERIAREKESLSGGVSSLRVSSEEIDGSVKKARSDFDEQRPRGVHSPTLESFGGGLEALDDQVRKDRENSDTQCHWVDGVVQELGNDWQRFVQETIPEK